MTKHNLELPFYDYTEFELLRMIAQNIQGGGGGSSVMFSPALPATGTSNIIYIRTSDWTEWVWTGTAYKQIPASTSSSNVLFVSSLPTTGVLDTLYFRTSDNTLWRWAGSAFDPVGYLSSRSTTTQLADSNYALPAGREWLYRDGSTDKALLGYHKYSGGWNAVEVGSEEDHLTLNSTDDGSTAMGDGRPLSGRPLMNWKNGALTEEDAVALVGLDIAPLAKKIDNLERMGSWLGSFATYAAVPRTVAAMEAALSITPTVNDVVTVRADEQKQGQCDTYRIAAISSTGDLALTYDHDIEIAPVTESGTCQLGPGFTGQILWQRYGDFITCAGDLQCTSTISAASIIFVLPYTSPSSLYTPLIRRDVPSVTDVLLGDIQRAIISSHEIPAGVYCVSLSYTR